MDQVRASVLTRAVLPALEELVAAEPSAWELIKGWNWSGGFGTICRQPIMISVRAGAIKVEKRRARPGELNLVFLTAKSLCAAMSGGIPFPFPIPTGGFCSLPGLKRFDRLGKLLKGFLEGAKLPGASEAALRAVFGVLGRALPIVAAGDAPSVKALRASKPATAHLQVIPLGIAMAISWDGTRLACNPGRQENANVDIAFQSMEAVRAAVAGTLDFQAAVGLGSVTVEGRILFADALGVVMDRTDLYLKV